MSALNPHRGGAHRRQHPATPLIECIEHFGRFTLPIVALMTVMFL